MEARYLSLTPFILWRHTERPIPWIHQFGREAPLEVEIGFGNGEFLVRKAQMHPERNFVGLDLEWVSVQRALRKIARIEVKNIRVLQVDARIAFERLFLPRSLSFVYSLFPCPWPKKRHVKYRLFSQSFLTLLNSRLVPEGEVQIVTDHQSYMQWLLTQVPGAGFVVDQQRISPRFDTKYERKWQGEGQEYFYELRLHKKEHKIVPLKEDVALEIHWVEHFDPDRFQPVHTQNGLSVEFLTFLYDPKRQIGMQRVVVVEENLLQDFWIEIGQKKGEKHWYIRPARGCGMVPTVGVQRALDLVRDAIQNSSR
jgi:tRNA (guanine-N7-)-methyltransferase